MIEEEDEESRKVRLEKEQQEKQELRNCMDKEVEEWELNKHRERELKERKRGRDQDLGVQTPGGTQGGGEAKQRRKVKARKLRFATVKENWGEDEELDSGQDLVELPPPPVIGRSGDAVNHVLLKKRNLMSSTITDYFSP